MKNFRIAMLSTAAVMVVVAVYAQAPAAVETPKDAVPAEAPVLDPNAPVTDEIDLEEIDDAAQAAKRPSVKSLKPGLSSEDESALVDIDCDDASLSDILRQFRKTTGANIISGDSTNLNRRVSVSLRKVPWLQGLQSILNSRGFRLEPRQGIFFVSEDQQLTPEFTKTFLLNHASAEELAKLFNSSYSIKDGTGKIVRQIATAFPAANVVVVKAPEKTLAECEAIIKAVDRPVLQAYIEARFVELDAGAARQLGIKWNSLANGWNMNVGPFQGGGVVTTAKASKLGEATSLNGGQKPYGAESGTPDLAYKNAFGLAGSMTADAFGMTLQAIESMDNATTFSNPKIIVANEHQARVDMTTKFPNVRVTASRTTVSGSTSMDISAQIEQIPGENKLLFAKEAFYSWGITLEVTPRISQDGLITVDIVPTISQLDTTVSADGFYSVESSSGDDANPYSKYPILAVKRIESQFTMKDGSTAVIGGLTKTVDEVKESGIPWLRSIPWIGPRLFSWKSRIKSQKEIIIFVTVGLANPADLPKDVGLPKNAVIAREYVEGRKLEPGDRSVASTIRIKGVEFENDAAKGATKVKPDEKKGTVVITPVTAVEEVEEEPAPEAEGKPAEGEVDKDIAVATDTAPVTVAAEGDQPKQGSVAVITTAPVVDEGTAAKEVAAVAEKPAATTQAENVDDLMSGAEDAAAEPAPSDKAKAHVVEPVVSDLPKETPAAEQAE